jgi:hypothetical protein
VNGYLSRFLLTNCIHSVLFPSFSNNSYIVNLIFNLPNLVIYPRIGIGICIFFIDCKNKKNGGMSSMSTEMQTLPEMYADGNFSSEDVRRIGRFGFGGFGRPFGGFGFGRPFGGFGFGRPFGGFGFGRPFFGRPFFGFGAPFFGGLAGGLLLGSALGYGYGYPYGYGYGYGYPYGYGYGYGYPYGYGYDPYAYGYY